MTEDDMDREAYFYNTDSRLSVDLSSHEGTFKVVYILKDILSGEILSGMYIYEDPDLRDVKSLFWREIADAVYTLPLKSAEQV